LEVERRAAGIEIALGGPPTLAVVSVGEDPASAAYLRQIERGFAGHRLAARIEGLPAGAGEPELSNLLGRLGADRSIQGILVQLPLPEPLTFEAVTRHVPFEKDVEGLHPLNAGALAQNRPAVVPSTPLAGLEILRAARIALAGKTAVVVGRSTIVGRPLAQLLLQEHATVVICHTRTPDLGSFGRLADVLAVAAGRAGLISGSQVKPGATVVDFGISVVDGRLVGDVDFESVSAVAGAITPVPGGTGPVTTAVLARNLVGVAECQLRTF